MERTRYNPGDIVYAVEMRPYDWRLYVDDTVSANEVHELYDVIKVDGKIWTIREKVW